MAVDLWKPWRGRSGFAANPHGKFLMSITVFGSRGHVTCTPPFDEKGEFPRGPEPGVDPQDQRLLLSCPRGTLTQILCRVIELLLNVAIYD